MGWLWTSTPPTGSSSSKESPFPPDHATNPISQHHPSAPPQSSPSSPPTKPLSRDDLADQELNSILQEFSTANTPAPKKQIYTRLRDPSNPSSTSTTTTNTTTEPISSQILPTTMSCRQAFDAAFYCNSFGGRFNDLYRYGELRSCSAHWNDFWFCMKTRTRTGPEKEEAIREFYREKERLKYSKYLGKDSSEAVWKSRDRKVEWGEAFSTPFPPVFDGSDEEWRAMELAARKASREGTNGTMS